MIRNALIWLVMALLPLQGYAAATMISCGPMHARMSSAAGHEHHHETGDGHHSHHQHDLAVPPDADEDRSSIGELMKFKCSACASCCTGSAAPSPVVPTVVADAAHGLRIPFFESPEGSIVPDGLERPPRTSLA